MFRSLKTIIRYFLIYFLVELLLFNSFYKYFKHFKNWIQQLNEEISEEIPDDGLKGSKHVGLFIKSVLSDFSVT